MDRDDMRPLGHTPIIGTRKRVYWELISFLYNLDISTSRFIHKVNIMKMPRTIKRYCPYCKTHTTQEVERVKKKKASELKWGQRRFRKVTAGYGGFPRPKPEGREKPTKRINLRYRCTQCKKANLAPCIRAKKFELTE